MRTLYKYYQNENELLFYKEIKAIFVLPIRKKLNYKQLLN